MSQMMIFRTVSWRVQLTSSSSSEREENLEENMERVEDLNISPDLLPPPTCLTFWDSSSWEVEGTSLDLCCCSDSALDSVQLL